MEVDLCVLQVVWTRMNIRLAAPRRLLRGITSLYFEGLQGHCHIASHYDCRAGALSGAFHLIIGNGKSPDLMVFPCRCLFKVRDYYDFASVLHHHRCGTDSDSWMRWGVSRELDLSASGSEQSADSETSYVTRDRNKKVLIYIYLIQK